MSRQLIKFSLVIGTSFAMQTASLAQEAEPSCPAIRGQQDSLTAQSESARERRQGYVAQSRESMRSIYDLAHEQIRAGCTDRATGKFLSSDRCKDFVTRRQFLKDVNERHEAAVEAELEVFLSATRKWLELNNLYKKKCEKPSAEAGSE